MAPRKRRPVRSTRMAPKQARKEDFALAMRRNPTEPERLLGEELRRAGYIFSTQQILNGYIVDFYFPLQKLIIEVDGHYHFTVPGRARDKVRTAVLLRRGYSMLRFTNAQVTGKRAEVLKAIEKRLKRRH